MSSSSISRNSPFSTSYPRTSFFSSDRLAALGIDILPAHGIAGFAVERAEGHLLGIRRRTRQLDGAGDEGEFQDSLSRRGGAP